MKIPQGHTEESVIREIRKVAHRLAPRFTFPPHTVRDMKQQVWVIALEALNNYDSERPLFQFLYVHVRNRLNNFLRDKFYRTEPPCTRCPLWDKKNRVCLKFADRGDCDIWKKWQKNNQEKMKVRVMEQLEYPSKVLGKFQDEVVERAEVSEMFQIIDRELPVGLRADYRRMMDNSSLPKRRREKLKEVIKEILERHGYGQTTT